MVIILTVSNFFPQITDQEREDLSDELCTVRMNPFGGRHARIVTHADVSSDDIRLASKKLAYVIGSFERAMVKTNPIELNGGHHTLNGDVEIALTNGLKINGHD